MLTLIRGIATTALYYILEVLEHIGDTLEDAHTLIEDHLTYGTRTHTALDTLLTGLMDITHKAWFRVGRTWETLLPPPAPGTQRPFTRIISDRATRRP